MTSFCVDAVQSVLLAQLGLDSEVQDYVKGFLGAIDEDEDEEDTTANLSAILAGFSESFADCSPEEQLATCTGILAAWQAALQDGSHEASPGLPPMLMYATSKHTEDAMSHGSLQRRNEKAETAKHGVQSEVSEVSATAPCPAPRKQATVSKKSPSFLSVKELCPQASEALIDYVLRQHDLHDALNLIFEHGAAKLEEDMLLDLRTQAAQKAREEQADAKAMERNRSAVMARYDEQVDRGDARHNPTPNSVARVRPGARLKKKARPKGGHTEVRYANNVAQHVKVGQKYVVENTQEAWDGGSRGKVNTKGKRGAG